MTPGRFRIGGYGIDLDDVTDATLASILKTATAMVNGYCAVPTHPAEYDFRGGRVVDEEKSWEIGHEMLPGQRSVYPSFTPLRGLEAFRIDVTNQQYISFQPGEVYVSDTSFEVVSLAMSSVGLFGTAIIPNIGLREPVARVTYTYGYRFPTLGEELYASDARQFRAMDQWWDSDAITTVYVDGVAVDESDYTVNHDEGAVTFAIVPDPDVTITADFTHRMPSNVAESTGLIAVQRLGERNLTRKGLYGLVELAVGEVRLRRDFPRAGVARHGVSDEVMQLLDPYRFVTVRGS